MQRGISVNQEPPARATNTQVSQTRGQLYLIRSHDQYNSLLCPCEGRREQTLTCLLHKSHLMRGRTQSLTTGEDNIHPRNVGQKTLVVLPGIHDHGQNRATSMRHYATTRPLGSYDKVVRGADRL